MSGRLSGAVCIERLMPYPTIGYGVSWCGRDVSDEHHFRGIDHALSVIEIGGATEVCPDCQNRIRALLTLSAQTQMSRAAAF